MRFHFVIEVHTPGLDRAIREGAHEIAEAIAQLGALKTPQIDGGTMVLDPQTQVKNTGGIPMATPIINSLPQHVTVTWTGTDASGSVVGVVPDAVDYTVSDPTLGTIAADAASPTSGAVFTPTSGATGDVTLTAVSHQKGLADFLQSVAGTLVNPTPAGVQITSGTMTLDPQAPATAKPASKLVGV